MLFEKLPQCCLLIWVAIFMPFSHHFATANFQSNFQNISYPFSNGLDANSWKCFAAPNRVFVPKLSHFLTVVSIICQPKDDQIVQTESWIPSQQWELPNWNSYLATLTLAFKIPCQSDFPNLADSNSNAYLWPHPKALNFECRCERGAWVNVWTFELEHL